MPFARTSNAVDAVLTKAPRLQTSDVDNVHFGHSLLFTRAAAFS